MPYLSRNDLEAVAKRVVTKFYSMKESTTDLCKIDIHQIAKQVLGLSIEHAKLSMDSSILGVTSYGRASLFILDETNTAMLYDLDGQTILIEQSLCAEDQKGRYNFTLAHETSHQILKLLFPKSYGIRNRASKAILYRTKTLKKSPLDWEEWQADTLASCILMPRDLIRKCLFRFGFQDKIQMLNRIFAHDDYVRFCCMSEFLGVSKEALSIRLKQMGILRESYIQNPYAIMDITV